jgi:hypothetical protein
MSGYKHKGPVSECFGLKPLTCCDCGLPEKQCKCPPNKLVRAEIPPLDVPCEDEEKEFDKEADEE